MKVRVTLFLAFLSALRFVSGLGLVPFAVNARVIYSQAPDQITGRASDVATREETNGDLLSVPESTTHLPLGHGLAGLGLRSEWSLFTTTQQTRLT